MEARHQSGRLSTTRLKRRNEARLGDRVRGAAFFANAGSKAALSGTAFGFAERPTPSRDATPA